MKKFLKGAAEKILAEGFTGAQSVVILPNRRSEIFLKEEIKKINKSNIWLPEFFPVDDFIQKVSGIKKADNIALSFELYNVYSKIEGAKAKTIDEFLTLAPVIISDFNDIDNSLADSKEIYEQLSAIKAIKAWNPDGRSLTELQLNYLHFFNSMYTYYTELRISLLSKRIGYQGLISRHLIDNITKHLNNLKWKNYIIVGINALSEAELQIFNFINQNFNTDFIWDVDDFYFGKKDKLNNQHEAGKHIHNIINKLKIPFPNPVSNYLTETKKSIRILGVPKNIGQAKFIGQEIKHNPAFLTDLNDNKKNLTTAIVLANEQLLIPLLHSLPFSTTKNDNPIPYNLTLGYPLKSSQIDHFFNSWIDIQISLNRNNTGISSNELITLLNSSFIKNMLNNKGSFLNTIINSIITNNLTFITHKNLQDLVGNKNKKSYSILAQLINFNNPSNNNKILDNLSTVLMESIEMTENQNILFHEQIQSFIKIISKLMIIDSQHGNSINLKALKKIGNQLISQSNINLIGEPLHGIQIMGMLETRALDFDNLYILSVNEGILPKTTNIDSFIPFDIRIEQKLPLPSDKSDIYSYHFYRLLQRAKNITLVYNSDSDKLGGGEKSRFILQIENELSKLNSNILLSNNIIHTDVSKSTSIEEPIEIIKNKEIVDKINEKSITGYSASLINSYIACPLKFYFSQLLKLDTNTAPGQPIEANTFGTIVHEVLENIYKPFVGKELNPELIIKSLPTVRTTVTSSFNKYFNTREVISGKNLLLFEMANNIINNFIRWDITNLKKARYILIDVENKIFVKQEINGNTIKFKGVIDRIDKNISNGNIRIIDYKTGSVEPRELVVHSIDKLTTDPKFAKAFQVAYYAWLFSKQNTIESIETGIISTRNISNGFSPLVLKEFGDIRSYFNEFEESICSIIDEISNQDIPIVQTTDNNRCIYCDYKSICNK